MLNTHYRVVTYRTIGCAIEVGPIVIYTFTVNAAFVQSLNWLVGGISKCCCGGCCCWSDSCNKLAPCSVVKATDDASLPRRER